MMRRKIKIKKSIAQDQVARSFVISEKSVWHSDSLAENCFSNGDHESNFLLCTAQFASFETLRLSTRIIRSLFLAIG
ncbi:hypothetical protein [Candidatus Liberibacter sp.]|uniref:hypothetical protein n=1 Tax=Candidatus Liberibacter sp. TaxID=34022 RepID=UPI0015F5CB96|nr:hypothetical protein [Candidatus Liberibacter sp.]MBA5723987.1 hypothetical protein [Candidatus Liberibacter sp.]